MAFKSFVDTRCSETENFGFSAAGLVANVTASVVTTAYLKHVTNSFVNSYSGWRGVFISIGHSVAVGSLGAVVGELSQKKIESLSYVYMDAKESLAAYNTKAK